ncbi:hypothetical protein Clacol_003031 [Clathrus columnatus]|uniref:T6SS Phospholipase effector Tle1-like catalytic domain-containing protein n=1 Tax=Clathrus columnatus TaxID=1419009 RepID=A0AAV5A592_9AGAM|nr:hypothetical protein Clacol_003031 [Clathrus columnatus]
MYLLARLLLLIIHTIYGLKNLLCSFIPSRSPKPLLARRRKVPTHISLLLVPNPENHDVNEERKVMIHCVERAIKWCKLLGIPRLSIYEKDERRVILHSLSEYFWTLRNDIRKQTPASKLSSRLTPPSSDMDSSSEQLVNANPLSGVIETIQIPYQPNQVIDVEKKTAKRKKYTLMDPKTQSLTLHLLSREASKPALAELTKTLVQRHKEDASADKFVLTVENVNTILEVESGFTPPDLLIVYLLYPSTAPLETHAYPPWHIRLSEIHYNPRHGGILRGLLRLLSSKRRKLGNSPRPITELDFRRALDSNKANERISTLEWLIHPLKQSLSELSSAAMAHGKVYGAVGLTQLLPSDGVIQEYRWQYSNILKIARALNHQDNKSNPPIPQIVFYQTGVGSQHNIYSEYVEGATGADLADKVQEAYAFIAQWGRIGVLDKKDMDRFADIFIAYQKRGNTTDHQVQQQYDAQLLNYQDIMENGRRRAASHCQDGFTIKCVGVFDTVGSLGLPKELTFWSKKFKELFGFSDQKLGLHIKYAYQAMALNETRKDFNVSKFEQQPEGLAKGQVLKQVWFAVVVKGSHSDIGGGWKRHDLSDLTLVWMMSNVESMLSIDRDYLFSLPEPVASWGKQLPHDPQTGIFKFAFEIQRTLPTETNNITHEYVHPSVKEQRTQIPQLLENIKTTPALICDLHEIEDKFKDVWRFIPRERINVGGENDAESDLENESQEAMAKSLEKMAKKAAQSQMESEVMVDEGGRPRYQESWIGSIVHELFGKH